MTWARELCPNQAGVVLGNGKSGSLNVRCARLRIERSVFESQLGTLCYVLGKNTIFTVPLFTQEYKWVPANLILGVAQNLGYPASEATPSCESGAQTPVLEHQV